jgi:hypothetical protein
MDTAALEWTPIPDMIAGLLSVVCRPKFIPVSARRCGQICEAHYGQNIVKTASYSRFV